MTVQEKATEITAAIAAETNVPVPQVSAVVERLGLTNALTNLTLPRNGWTPDPIDGITLANCRICAGSMVL